MMNRVLVNALGLSLLVHGLVLGFGGMVRAPVSESPRLLEARLVAEPPPPSSPEPLRSEAARPVAPAAEPAHRARSSHTAAVPRPVPTPRPMVSQRAEPTVPALVAPPSSPSASATADVSESVTATAPAVSSRAGAGPSAGAGSAAYSPPGFGASYLHNPKPSYPLMARRRGLEGVVRLDVRVSAEGIPTGVKIRESSGHESLDEAALIAVWHWRFSPARRGGEPVEGAVVVPVRFNLEGDIGG
ncbi:MAG: energy transducer TonB [Zoogloea sp.]|nr:MAG: energy transducer TonB [Zoogloea sp.]